MICENFVYRFMNENDKVIYVGKATNIINRLKVHNHLPKSCYQETKRIEILGFLTQIDCDQAEIYYIQKYNPFYNVKHTGKEVHTPIPFLDGLKWVLLEEAHILEVENCHNEKKFKYYRVNTEYYSESGAILSLTERPKRIKTIKEPTDEMIKVVLKNEGSLIEFLMDKFPERISQELCMIAFETYFSAIKYLTDPSIEDCLKAIKSDPSLIRFINYRIDEIYEEVLKSNIDFIHEIENPTIEMTNIVLKKDGRYIKYLEDITYHQALLAVKQNGLALQWVPEYLQEDCVIPEAAINQNPLSIKYAEYVNEDIVNTLIDKAPEVLIYTDFERWGNEIILKALTKMGRLLRYVNKEYQTLEMCEIAVKQDPTALIYAKFKTFEMCRSAVLQNASLFRYVPYKYQTNSLYGEVIDSNPQNVGDIPKNQLEDWMYWKALKMDYSIFYSVYYRVLDRKEALSYVFERERDVNKFFSRLDWRDTEILPDEISRKCLTYNGLLINRFKNPPEHYCLTAISENILAAAFIEELTPACYNMVYELIKQKPIFNSRDWIFLLEEIKYSEKRYFHRWDKILNNIESIFGKSKEVNLKKFKKQVEQFVNKTWLDFK